MKIDLSLRLYLLGLLVLIFISCNKKRFSPSENVEKVMGYVNENYYPAMKMDSMESISHITQQKLQEIYDLAALVIENKKNAGIDTLLLTQMKSYFPFRDTLYVEKIIFSLDSIHAKYAKIELKKSNTVSFVSLNDSLNTINFDIQYFNKNHKNFLTAENKVGYIFKKDVKKSTPNFKFYFSFIEPHFFKENPEKNKE